VFFGKKYGSKAEAQFHRLMSEFPWLWAVRSVWYPGITKIFVSEISNDWLSDQCQHVLRPDEKLWMKLGGNTEWIVAIETKPEIKIADAAWRTLCLSGTKSITEYLAITSGISGDKGVRICRAPKGEDLHDMVVKCHQHHSRGVAI